MRTQTAKSYRLIPMLALTLTGLAWPAQAATTNVSQAVNPGLLSLTAPATASLPPAITNADADGTSSGSLGVIQVMDNRGTYAGWSLTASTSNFSQVKQPIASRQGSPAVTSAGSYSGVLNGQYVITITAGGGLGAAQFSYSGLENDASKTIPADGNVVLGSRGVTATFGAGTYQVGDRYTIEADQMSASGVSLTPTSLTTIDGSPSGLHLGTAYQFSSSNDSATILSADAGNGFGFYSTAPILHLTIPARSPIGTYTGTITETLN